MLNADRALGNMLEQALPFLLSLWLFALYVDGDLAGKLGLAYVSLRWPLAVLFHDLRIGL